MATRKSTSKTAVKETPKEEEVTVDQLINQCSGNIYTVEHLNKSAAHLHELSLMIDEGKESSDFELMIQGIGILIDFYANEIEHCTGYFAQIVERGGVLKDRREKGGAE